MKWLNSACLGDEVEGAGASADTAVASIAIPLERIQAWVRGWSGYAGDEISFVESTTAACDGALMAVARGSEVFLRTSSAHPTICASLQAVADWFARIDRPCDLKIIDLMNMPRHSSTAFVEAFCKQVKGLADGRDGVMVLEHVTYDHGLRLPVDIIAKKLALEQPGLRIIIDGAQAAGLWSPGNAPAAAYLGCFHKFIAGPTATGFLWIASDYAKYLPSHVVALSRPSISGRNLPTLDLKKWRRVARLLQQFGGERRAANLDQVEAFNRKLALGLGPIATTLGAGVDVALRSHINTIRFATVADAMRIEGALANEAFAVQRFDDLIRISIGCRSDSEWGLEIGKVIRDLVGQGGPLPAQTHAATPA